MKIRLLLVGALLSFVYVCIIDTSDVAAASVEEPCADVDIIFARGSGQALSLKENNHFREEVEKRVTGEASYHYYELGTEEYEGAKYPAVDVGLRDGNLAGAVISYGHANDYGKSVAAGKTELLGYLKERSQKCPDERIVLAGYSQGAQVVGEESAELSEYASRIDFVALFGDPKLYLPEGEGFNPPACRGEEMSPYRRAITNCDTDNGSLGARKPYLMSVFMNKTGLWCNDKDVVCGTSKNPLDTANHMTYWHAGGAIDAAAREALTRVKASLPPEKAANVDVRILKPGEGTSGQDTAFVIDITGSMGAKIEKAKEFARTFAQKLTVDRGRVALVAYSDDTIADPFTAKVMCPFTDNVEEFQAALGNLGRGDGGDTPEALLHGLNVAFDELDWKAGATKAAVVLTDAGYHNPDTIDGATDESIAKRALELDPVNIYPVVPTNLMPEYRSLAEKTSGQVIADSGDTAAALTTAFTKIQNRPTAVLKLTEYTANPGQSIHFDAAGSYVVNSSIAKYDWDFNGDGVFDQSTDAPAADRIYNDKFDGYMQVRVTSNDGSIATASAIVKVGTKIRPELPAAPKNLSVKVLETTAGQSRARLTWKPSDSRAVFWQIYADGVPLGRITSDRTSIEITDLPRNKDITFSLEGLLSHYTPGQSASVTLEKETPSAHEKSWISRLLECWRRLLSVWLRSPL